jgi:hypothetical protein
VILGIPSYHHPLDQATLISGPQSSSIFCIIPVSSWLHQLHQQIPPRLQDYAAMPASETGLAPKELFFQVEKHHLV